MANFPGKAIARELWVGCDPEFALKQEIRDEVFQLPYGLLTLRAGADNGLAELRPPPSQFTLVLVKRLASLMWNAKLYRGRVWRGSPHPFLTDRSKYYSAGGHVHFGVHIRKGRRICLEDHPFSDILSCDRAVPSLDELTDRLEELDILPQKECADRRNICAYGRKGDVRYEEEHDDPMHWEYRTMGTWLFHPCAAITCLTFAKLAVIDPSTVCTSLRELKGRAGLRKVLELFRSEPDADFVREKIDLSKTYDPSKDMHETWVREGRKLLAFG